MKFMKTFGVAVMLGLFVGAESAMAALAETTNVVEAITSIGTAVNSTIGLTTTVVIAAALLGLVIWGVLLAVRKVKSAPGR